jgi:hypothetical protein
MTQTSKKFEENTESGIALLIAIFVLLLITAIGAGMIMLTNTEINTSSNFRDEQTAFFSAKAGFEEVRDRFRSSASNSLNGILPVTLLGSAGGTLYILNPKNAEADTPWVTNGAAYPDNEVCSELTNMGLACANPVAGYATTTASSSYAANPVMAWKWTRVNLKTNYTSSGSTATSSVDGQVWPLHDNYVVCWTGTNEITTPFVASAVTTCANAGTNYLPVYVLTTLAVTPSGSRRMVQAEATATLFPNIPSPLTFDGSNPTFGAPNSAAFTVDGTDHSGPTSSNANGPGNACPSGRPAQYAIGGYNPSSVTALAGDVSSRPGDYTGAGGSTPSVSNVSGALGTLATVGGLEALVTQVTNVASPANVYNGASTSSITNPGTIANPVINVVTGDLSLGGGFTGAGILLVEGNLTMSGNPNFNGLILVIGKGSMTKNGGGNGTMDGALLIANLYNSATPPVLLPGSSAPGAPTLNWNGGGNATFNYDSCWSSALSGSLNYRIVAVREMMK